MARTLGIFVWFARRVKTNPTQLFGTHQSLRHAPHFFWIPDPAAEALVRQTYGFSPQAAAMPTRWLQQKDDAD